jgi:hypothetical protein
MTDRLTEIRARLAQVNALGGHLVDLEWACAEIERLTRERDAAFRAGAEAMREVCAVELEEFGVAHLDIAARDIRALPIPEAKR